MKKTVLCTIGLPAWAIVVACLLSLQATPAKAIEIAGSLLVDLNVAGFDEGAGICLLGDDPLGPERFRQIGAAGLGIGRGCQERRRTHQPLEQVGLDSTPGVLERVRVHLRLWFGIVEPGLEFPHQVRDRPGVLCSRRLRADVGQFLAHGVERDHQTRVPVGDPVGQGPLQIDHDAGDRHRLLQVLGRADLGDPPSTDRRP